MSLLFIGFVCGNHITTLCWQQCKQIGGSLRRRRRKKKVLGDFVGFT
jgi:hypothetical protein